MRPSREMSYYLCLSELWARQCGTCATCGRIHSFLDTMEIAHRIANTKTNRKVYGAAVIDDIDNLRGVCRGGMYKGRSCNDYQNIGNKPATAKALAKRIREKHDACRAAV